MTYLRRHRRSLNKRAGNVFEHRREIDLLLEPAVNRRRSKRRGTQFCCPPAPPSFWCVQIRERNRDATRAASLVARKGHRRYLAVGGALQSRSQKFKAD